MASPGRGLVGLGLEESLQSAEAEATRWAYEDGLADFSVGAVFVAIAVLAGVESRLPQGSPLHGVWALGLPVIILTAIALGRVVTPWWRERVTYRRSGYAVLRRTHPRRVRTIAMLTAGAISMALGAAVVRSPRLMENMLLLQGVAIGALLAMIGWKAGAMRFLVLAVLTVGLGALLTLRTLDETVASAWFYGLTGAAALGSGAWALHTFLGRGVEGTD